MARVKNTRQIMEVMQAYLDGKKIEKTYIYNEYATKAATWYPAKTPEWDWERWDYRVKPEPREFAVLITSTGLPIGVGEVGAAQVLPFSSRDLATEARVIKVREVL